MHETLEALHDRRVQAVTEATVKLATLPQMTPEAVFQGSIQGAAVIMLANPDMTVADVVEMIREMAAALETAGKPKLGLVK